MRWIKSSRGLSVVLGLSTVAIVACSGGTGSTSSAPSPLPTAIPTQRLTPPGPQPTATPTASPTAKPTDAPAATATSRLTAASLTGTVYVYSAKYVCGTEQSEKPKSLTGASVTGIYRTAINVHNFMTTSVSITKKAVIALPEDDPRGAISKRVSEELKDDEALDVSCSDVVKLLANVGTNVNLLTGVMTGFVEIQSPIEIQVTAVYTTGQASDQSGRIDVQQVLPHVVKQ